MPMATDELHDTPMGDADDTALGPTTALVMSEDEQRVLKLYDRLRELQLQIALLEAQTASSEGSPHSKNQSQNADDDVEAARSQLLEARAAYILRNEVADSVLTVNPVLKAVHRATRASPIERDLLPAVEQRDAASQAVAQLANARRAVEDEHAAVAAESRRVRWQNEALAEQLRSQLAEAAAAEEDDDDNGRNSSSQGNADSELARLQQEVKASRQRWRLIKGTASAIVIGSGVDWARDAELRDLVLDPE